MKRPKISIKKLLELCFQNDENAKKELYFKYVDLVDWAIRKTVFGLSKKERLPINHDIWVKVLMDDCKRLKKLQDYHKLPGYLAKIARNYTKDHFKKIGKLRKHEILKPDIEQMPEAVHAPELEIMEYQLTEDERYDLLKDCINRKASSLEKEIIKARYDEETGDKRSFKEIAEMLGKSEVGVRQALDRFRKKARRFLAKTGLFKPGRGWVSLFIAQVIKENLRRIDTLFDGKPVQNKYARTSFPAIPPELEKAIYNKLFPSNKHSH